MTGKWREGRIRAMETLALYFILVVFFALYFSMLARNEEFHKKYDDTSILLGILVASLFFPITCLAAIILKIMGDSD